jgi:ABC-type multidrug transport system fused ATPase/permease subunit
MISGIKARLRLLSLLDPGQGRRARHLLALMFVGMLLEMLGVGLVVPVIILLMQQDASAQPAAFRALLDGLGPMPRERLVACALLALVAVYAVKSGFLSFLAWRRARFAFGLQAELAQRLFASYIAQPYTFHLRRNSAQLIRNASGEITMWTGNVVMPSLLLVAESLVLLGLCILLLAVEPVGTLVVVSVLGGIVAVFHRVVRQRVTEWGRRRQHHEGMRIQHLQQSLGSIKEVKLLGREADFMDQFNADVTASALAGQKQAVLLQIPGLWLELLGVLGLTGMVFAMMSLGHAPASIVPTLGMFAAAAFRLMPSANRMLGALQQLRYGLPVSDMLYQELHLKADPLGPKPGSTSPPFQRVIAVESLTYNYEGSATPAVEGVSLRIRKGESIGLIGASGSGKSTLIDLLLGLVQPQSGCITIDGQDIYTNLRGWQNLIGYVPQTIYLTDDSLRRNIALGVAATDIDDAAVESALHAAQLAPWVATLPEGLETVVGERGVRLSGGQRQRIGIARALYHRPVILVLDEATSALDTQTEKDVMEAITALRGNKTIVMVAHRLSTLMQCDRLYRLDKGHLVEVLSPADIAQQTVGMEENP